MGGQWIVVELCPHAAHLWHRVLFSSLHWAGAILSRLPAPPSAAACTPPSPAPAVGLIFLLLR